MHVAPTAINPQAAQQQCSVAFSFSPDDSLLVTGPGPLRWAEPPPYSSMLWARAQHLSLLDPATVALNLREWPRGAELTNWKTNMTNLSADQTLRIQCLQICSGSVAEAKNAYYWVTGEQGATKQATAVQAGASSQLAKQQALQRQVEQNAVAAAQGFDQYQQQNARKPYIGGGSSD
jgi:hypothetical protein